MKDDIKKKNRIEIIRMVVDEIDSFGREISSYREATRTYGTNDELTEIEAKAVELIGKDPNIGVVKLSRRIGRTKGGTSMIIDRLEKKGLLKRVKSEKDNRYNSLLLTEKGNIVFNTHEMQMDVFYAGYEKILKDYSKEDLEKCKKILKILHQNWE